MQKLNYFLNDQYKFKKLFIIKLVIPDVIHKLIFTLKITYTKDFKKGKSAVSEGKVVSLRKF